MKTKANPTKPSSIKQSLRATIIFSATVLTAMLMISQVLPWLASNGYAGDVIKYSYQNELDATPLFYTESDRTWEILDQIREARR